MIACRGLSTLLISFVTLEYIYSKNIDSLGTCPVVEDLKKSNTPPTSFSLPRLIHALKGCYERISSKRERRKHAVKKAAQEEKKSKNNRWDFARSPPRFYPIISLVFCSLPQTSISGVSGKIKVRHWGALTMQKIVNMCACAWAGRAGSVCVWVIETKCDEFLRAWINLFLSIV